MIKTFIRKMKLSKLSGKEVVFPKKPSGICLFEKDYNDFGCFSDHNNGYLYMNYDEIVSFFYKNYSSNWLEIRKLVDSWLKETDKANVLTSLWRKLTHQTQLKETEKVNVLTSLSPKHLMDIKLKKSGKVNVLISIVGVKDIAEVLNETEKVNILTSCSSFSSFASRLKGTEKVNILTSKYGFPNQGEWLKD